MNDEDLREEGYTDDHFCDAMKNRTALIREHAIDVIAKKDDKWWAICEDYYYTDEIFFCPFCGSKL